MQEIMTTALQTILSADVHKPNALIAVSISSTTQQRNVVAPLSTTSVVKSGRDAKSTGLLPALGKGVSRFVKPGSVIYRPLGRYLCEYTGVTHLWVHIYAAFKVRLS